MLMLEHSEDFGLGRKSYIKIAARGKRGRALVGKKNYRDGAGSSAAD